MNTVEKKVVEKAVFLTTTEPDYGCPGYRHDIAQLAEMESIKIKGLPKDLGRQIFVEDRVFNFRSNQEEGISDRLHRLREFLKYHNPTVIVCGNPLDSLHYPGDRSFSYLESLLMAQDVQDVWPEHPEIICFYQAAVLAGSFKEEAEKRLRALTKTTLVVINRGEVKYYTSQKKRKKKGN